MNTTSLDVHATTDITGSPMKGISALLTATRSILDSDVVLVQPFRLPCDLSSQVLILEKPGHRGAGSLAQKERARASKIVEKLKGGFDCYQELMASITAVGLSLGDDIMVVYRYEPFGTILPYKWY